MTRAHSAAHGEHRCYVAPAAERLPTVVPSWVAEGIARDELVVLVTTEVGTLIDDLTSAGVHAAALRDDGRLVMRTPEEAFLTDGVLDGQVCLDRLRGLLEQARADGRRGLRVAGRTADLLALAGGVEPLLAFEAAIDAFCASIPIAVLCLTDREALDAFSGDLSALAALHADGAADDLGTISSEPGRVVLRGELDSSNLDLLRGVLRSAEAEAGLLVVDAGDLRFADLRATTEVLRLATRVAPDAVTIDRPPRSVRRILETAGWDAQPNLTVTTR